MAEYTVPLLTDSEIQEIVDTFPELSNLNTNPRSRDLLRRLVVVDLLVRGGLTGVPLSDADAMIEVWSGLVRRNGSSARDSRTRGSRYFCDWLITRCVEANGSTSLVASIRQQ